MKKAQWKADPRTRAFGVDPRELRVRELEGELQALKENNELWRYKAQHYQNEQSKLAEQVGQIYQYRAAYKWLALTGVVLEYEGEFKHLKGADMDEFFGLDKITTPQTHNPYTAALVDSMRQTKEAVLTGTSIYKMWTDEMLEVKNGSNS